MICAHHACTDPLRKQTTRTWSARHCTRYSHSAIWAPPKICNAVSLGGKRESALFGGMGSDEWSYGQRGFIILFLPVASRCFLRFLRRFSIHVDQHRIAFCITYITAPPPHRHTHKADAPQCGCVSSLCRPRPPQPLCICLHKDPPYCSLFLTLCFLTPACLLQLIATTPLRSSLPFLLPRLHTLPASPPAHYRLSTTTLPLENLLVIPIHIPSLSTFHCSPVQRQDEFRPPARSPTNSLRRKGGKACLSPENVT